MCGPDQEGIWFFLWVPDFFSLSPWSLGLLSLILVCCILLRSICEWSLHFVLLLFLMFFGLDGAV